MSKYANSLVERLIALTAQGSRGPRGQYKGSSQFRKKRRNGRSKARPSMRISRPMKGMNNRVKELTRLAESDMGTHTHRVRATWNVIAAENAQNALSIASISVTEIELVLDQLRYYDPSNPATLLVAAGGTGTYQKEFYFKSVHSKLTARNNYRVPCMLSVYMCRSKADTNLTPLVSVVDGLADKSTTTFTEILTYPSDSRVFTDLWKIEKSKKILLQPGAQCVVSGITKPFTYSPNVTDVHNREYQSKFHGMAWMVFVSGVPAHDSSFDEQGTSGAGADLIFDTVSVLKYPAGADIEYLYVDDRSPTFTTGPTVTNRPVASNQVYGQGLGM